VILIAERLPRCEVVVENVREQKRAALHGFGIDDRSKVAQHCNGAIDLIRSAI
jgi:hypothetical protein